MNAPGKILLSRELRTEMWLALAARLGEGEALYSNAHFRTALLEIYQQITGQDPPASMEEEVRSMVETVNREHPETYLARAVQNGIAKAFEEGVRKNNWDLAKIQASGASALRRFSQLETVRDVLEDANLTPSQLSMVSCVQQVIEQVAPRQDTPPQPPPSRPPAFRPDLAAQEPVAAPAAPAKAAAEAIDPETEAAIASGDVDAEVARERAKAGEQRRAALEEQEQQKVPGRLDGLVEQGVVTEEEAGQLRELRKIDERVKSGEITEAEATEIRNSLVNAKVRDKLERKVREAVADSVKYLQVFESMKKISPKYHDAIAFLIEHKNLVTAADDAGIDQGSAIKALMEDMELLDDVTDIMERKDHELRMISVRLHPYSSIMNRGVERIGNMTIEEVFVEDLAKVDVDEMSDRLSSGDAQQRVRPAADMRCLISLIDHVTKRTRFRKELRLLRIARQVEEFYKNTSDMNEARHQAENFLNRRLRRMFPDMNADETAELKQRSTEMMDQIEQRIHDERKAEVEAKRAKTAAPAAQGAGGGDGDEELSADELQKGVQIGRVEMRVAGNTRRIPTKIMPDPDDPEVMVIVMRDPETQELLPAKRRGAKRTVERNRDGYWAEVR
ncbi:MAG TPA: hypothetical protein QGF95_14510 [Candidatus Latescibacteria bacterium]|nr:hypothetical protein [Gemmatimonadaceae bacterium]HJP31759.1 hypothetical protein [Candidatus Latescibacterota bacterium]